MTREEIADEVGRIVFAFDSHDSRRDEVRRLVDEVRALPVVATCWTCPAREEHMHEVLCDHDDAGEYSRRVALYRGDNGPPPSWCPLRGAR